jgi:large subunit ribosomal protein L13
MIKTPIKREKIEIDATDKAVGRVATVAAMALRGKNKPGFAPHLDNGSRVTIINAGKVKFTGRKLVQKDYYHHSMHPGGIKRVPMQKLFIQNPTIIMRKAINGMLPKNRLRNEMMKRLTIKP